MVGIAAALPAVALPGCRGPAADFMDARAEAICARHARCETLEVAGFDDEAACVEDLLAAADRARDAGQDDCPGYDDAAADGCVDELERAPCDDAPDLRVCDAVCQGD